jgi:hypothetical protein
MNGGRPGIGNSANRRRSPTGVNLRRYSDFADRKLYDLGGLSLALAQVLKVIHSDLKNPGSEHWERAFRTFDLVL